MPVAQAPSGAAFPSDKDSALERAWNAAAAQVGMSRARFDQLRAAQARAVSARVPDPDVLGEVIRESPRALERVARKLFGLSSREAKRLAAGGWAALTHAEPDDVEEVDQEAVAALLDRISKL